MFTNAQIFWKVFLLLIVCCVIVGIVVSFGFLEDVGLALETKPIQCIQRYIDADAQVVCWGYADLRNQALSCLPCSETKIRCDLP